MFKSDYFLEKEASQKVSKTKLFSCRQHNVHKRVFYFLHYHTLTKLQRIQGVISRDNHYSMNFNFSVRRVWHTKPPNLHF